MINSARRVFSALLVVGILGFGGSLAIISPNCSLWCSASVAFAPLALDSNLEISPNSGSTKNIAEVVAPELVVTKEVFQTVSIYALFLAIVMLLVLEIREIHYLKLLVPRHRA